MASNVILEVVVLHPGHCECDGCDPGAGQPVAARKLHFAHIKHVLVSGRVCLVRGEGEHVGNVLSDLVAIGRGLTLPREEQGGRGSGWRETFPAGLVDHHLSVGLATEPSHDDAVRNPPALGQLKHGKLAPRSS